MSKWVQKTLVLLQITNLCLIIMVITITTAIYMIFQTINDVTVQDNIRPYITNVQSVLVLALFALPLVPLRFVLWRHSAQAQPLIRVQLFAFINLGLNILVWSVAIIVLLIRWDGLSDSCWSAVEGGEVLKNCRLIDEMRVRWALSYGVPRVPANAQVDWICHLHRCYSGLRISYFALLLCICRFSVRNISLWVSAFNLLVVCKWLNH